MKTLKNFEDEVRKATSQEELRSITYSAFLQDDDALSGKRTLYNKVVTLCVKREAELADIQNI